MSFGFLKNFAKVKAGNIKENLIDAIVKLDPSGASKAELANMQEKFEELSEMLERARATLKKEEAEAVAAKKVYNNRITMIDIINKRIEENENVEENSEALHVLLEDMDELSEMAKTEIQEAEEALEYFNEINIVTREFGSKLTNAQKNLEKAKGKMEKAEVKLLKNQEREQRAKELSGLVGSKSATSVALDAMTKAAEEMNIKADATNTRASILEKPKKSNTLLDALHKELSGNNDDVSLVDKSKTYSKL